MKIAGSTLGIGVWYTAMPVPAVGEAGEMMRWLGKKNGEEVTPFSFVQLSDAHVGFNGPPDPLGTKWVVDNGNLSVGYARFQGHPECG